MKCALVALTLLTTTYPAHADPPKLYDLEVQLVDQDGAASNLDVFRGSPVIVSLFYASCPMACPRLIADIQRIIRGIDESKRSRVKVLLVSLDPKNDSVAMLKKAAVRHGLDGSWKLTRASEEKVRELAAVLDVKYRFKPDGEIEHSSVLVFVGPDGQIHSRIEGLGQAADPARLKASGWSVE